MNYNLENNKLFVQQTIKTNPDVLNSTNPIYEATIFGMDLKFDAINFQENGFQRKDFDKDENGVFELSKYVKMDENNKVSFSTQNDEYGEIISYSEITIDKYLDNGQVERMSLSDRNKDGVFDYYRYEYGFENEEGHNFEGYNITFDDNGTIKRYKEIVDNYNALSDSYVTEEKIDLENDGKFDFAIYEKIDFDEDGSCCTEYSQDENLDGFYENVTITEQDENRELKRRTTKCDTDNDNKYDCEIIEEFDTSRGDIPQMTSYSFNINSEIENSKQGRIGDCWLLAGINAFDSTPYGREIIKNAITENEDGSYTVDFKGINKSYVITGQELFDATLSGQYSKGDHDVLLMELAFEKAFMDIEKNPNEHKIFQYDFNVIDAYEDHILDGGYFDYVTYMLTGEFSEFCNKQEKRNTFLDNFEKNPEKYSACIGFDNAQNNNENLTALDINGKEVILAGSGKHSGHAWTLKAVDENTVTMVNPWDSSKDVVMDKDTFLEYYPKINYFEFK